MKLTDKAKVDFEKWFRANTSYWNISRTQADLIDWYNSFPDSCKYGVYVDWFDSRNLFIELCYTEDWGYEVSHSETEDSIVDWGFDTRHEARTKAIRKANEIYNNN